jgi:hypothetical protein
MKYTITLFLLVALANAPLSSAKVGGTITPELLQQYNFKVVQIMPCDWSGRNDLFAYYGTPPDVIQYDVHADYEFILGQNYNLQFNSTILERDGKPLHRIDIDYRPDPKKTWCKNQEFGFPGQLTNTK